MTRVAETKVSATRVVFGRRKLLNKSCLELKIGTITLINGTIGIK